MACLELHDVELTFQVRTDGPGRLARRALKSLARARAGQPHGPQPIGLEVRALQGVSLHVGEGERLGVIGRNGSGKTTLLKVLAGVYPPTHGRRRVTGRVSSLFDISLGFEPDASGWENIIFRGYLLGETPRSIRAKMGAIADFSELGGFLNLPVRSYSAGMRMRLAFAIATAVEPEILLVDECLSVGDLGFRAKARQRMLEMMNRARIIVLVSHDLQALPELCDSGIWLHGGKVQQQGAIREVIAAYEAFATTAAAAA